MAEVTLWLLRWGHRHRKPGLSLGSVSLSFWSSILGKASCHVERTLKQRMVMCKWQRIEALLPTAKCGSQLGGIAQTQGHTSYVTRCRVCTQATSSLISTPYQRYGRTWTGQIRGCGEAWRSQRSSWHWKLRLCQDRREIIWWISESHLPPHPSHTSALLKALTAPWSLPFFFSFGII